MLWALLNLLAKMKTTETVQHFAYFMLSEMLQSK